MNRQVIVEFSDTIGSMVQNIVDGNKITRAEVMAMANGGLVPERTAGLNVSPVGEQISELLKQNLDLMVNNRLTQVFNNLNKEFGKQSYLDSSPSLGDEYTPDFENEDGNLGFDGDYKQLLDLIASVEGNYDSLNTGGSAGGTIAHGSSTAAKKFGKPFSQMTVNEVMLLQQRGIIHATGRYQIIRSTLRGLVKDKAYGETGVSGDDLYNAQTQDKLGIALINYRLKTGANPANFRNEWVGLKKIDDRTLQQAIDRAKGGNIESNVRQSVSMGKIPKADYIKGVLDESGESGFDVTWKGDNNIAILPGRVKEVGQLYGSGYGNVVVIESIDPVTGKKVDVMYAHFPTGGISVREGQQVNSGQVLGRMGKPGERGIGNINGQHASIDFYEPNRRRGQITGKYSRWAGLSREVISAAQTGNNPKKWPKPSGQSQTRTGSQKQGQYDVLIPLDHVKTSALTDDPRYPNASLGAEGIERRYQEQAAAQVKANLERSGLRVKIMAPEDYGGYASYDSFIRNQTKGGAIVVPIHLDAVKSAGGVGALTRIRSGDAGDKALARTIDPVLKAFTSKHGLTYGGTDTQSNKTVNLSGSNSASVLIELGIQAELRRKFGPNFMQHPEVKRLLAEISQMIIKAKNKPQTVAKLTTSTSLAPNKINSQAIASNYTIPTVERTVIVNRKEIQQVIATPPAVVVPGLFPGESSRVNNEAYSVLNT
jgi:hypothetical protein